MKAPYSQELEALPHVYRDALTAPVNELSRFLHRLGSAPAAYIGSGGAMAVAHLAARLHEQVSHQPAQACTALEALSLQYQPSRGAMLVSSSAKHPDSKLVLESFRRRLFGRCGVLTHKDPECLIASAGPDTEILQLPPLPQRDGFLATGSVMQMAVTMLRAAGHRDLPADVRVDCRGFRDIREEVLILVPPSLMPVALDLEVRLVESGLAAVQVSDFRNFAHGRHTGFARRIDQTTVISLSDQRSEGLASGTLGCLPSTADVQSWHESEPWPRSLPALLARSMVFVEAVGEKREIDVARPSVPKFGRQLYRLPLRRRVPLAASDAVARKQLARQESGQPITPDRCREAYDAWFDQLSEKRFSAVVMDYDGTVCWTSRRFDLPSEGLRDRMIALLEGETMIGFASGRGRSLYTDLRKWVPQPLWPRVVVGLYNGGVVLDLDQDLGDLRAGTDWSGAVARALTSNAGVSSDLITERGHQVSIDAFDGADRLTQLARERLDASDLPATVVASGHSVDIVPDRVSKVAVVEQLELATGGDILAIGDQGHGVGNDFELLACRPWTLTVGTCSPDLGRCWFAGDGSRLGPDLLDRYLSSLRPLRGGLAVRGLASL